MPDVDQYAPGTPSWIDVNGPDLDASAAFYSGLFGWEVAEAAPDDAAGGYRLFRLRGRDVAGLAPLQDGAPIAWTSYVSVADVGASAAAVGEAGGAVLMEPFDVLESGHMAVVADPQGAAFCLWQARNHPGCGIVNEPGSLIWNELTVRDPTAVSSFYERVFGWTGETTPMGDMEYTTFHRDGEQVAGMVQMTDAWPPEIPAHWMVYFAVDDVDAAAARAAELGGAVSVPPTEIPVGRFAVLNDPAGAVFSVIRMNPDAMG
jgi:hypothetical protein